MGMFEKAYEVDGERFELYVQSGEGGQRFQLVDEEGFPLGDPFEHVPDQEVVVALVRAVGEASEPSAA